MHSCRRNRGVQDMSLLSLTVSLPEVSMSPRGVLYIFHVPRTYRNFQCWVATKQRWKFIALLQWHFQYIMARPGISWLGIISLNRIFSKAWAKSSSHLSKLWRERKEKWSKLQQSWNERMYMLVISPLFPCITHTHTPTLQCCALICMQGWQRQKSCISFNSGTESASVCLTRQISKSFHKEAFFSSYMFLMMWKIYFWSGKVCSNVLNSWVAGWLIV